jgi:hypothetical protein
MKMNVNVYFYIQMSVSDFLLNSGNNAAQQLINNHMSEKYKPLVHKLSENIVTTLHGIRKDRLIKPLQ